ncbi:hypothetical protein A2501_03530 [Candidatus Uhrbacteria bacterium RIFOXYC12_FULL_57_11]|nr:MAG: hypothetical protein A2501_03530 [Candidatus Uhrbacteria bacterium RIFOXYC12_FULL_57_11]
MDRGVKEKKERRVEAKELPPYPVGSATEASPRHPDVNQDAFVVDAKRQLLMVADGVTASTGGEHASDAARQATEDLSETLDEMIQDAREETGVPYLTLEQASSVMDAHFRSIADRVKDAVSLDDARKYRAATTLMTAKVFETAPSETYAIVKSIGDCQAMVLRVDGRLECIDIEEDSAFAERIRNGELSEDEAYLIYESGSQAEFVKSFLEYQAELGMVPRNAAELVTDTSENFERWDLVPDSMRTKLRQLLKLFNNYYSGARPERSVVTQYVGNAPGVELRVHSAIIRLDPGDRLFITSDGIDALKQSQIRDALARGATPEQSARMLVSDAAEANSKGDYLSESGEVLEVGKSDLRAKPDDITVVGLEVPRLEIRPWRRLVEAGFEDDVAYAQGTIDDLVRELEAFRAAHPELQDLGMIEATGNDVKSRAAYVKIIGRYARQYPDGVEGLKRDVQPFLAEERAILGRIEAMQSELTLAQARQQRFETERAARKNDPESPVWRKRVENARARVVQLKRLADMSRAQADVKAVEAARRKAMALADNS